MTQRDKFAKRKCVLKYWAYKAELKILGAYLPESNSHLIFYLPMPKSLSKKKKLKMNLMPHQQIPDLDNLEKGFLDAIFENDAHIWDGRITKRWAYTGYITVDNLE